MAMQVFEYDEVDPLEVLHLNLLCRDFALTPEYVATMRRLDPRPFPCLAVYAQAGATVAGQAGIFRLPMVSTQGADEVGGVWAVAIHPAFTRRGTAVHLLEEVHTRMRFAGLRYSTLEVQRYHSTYALFRRLGYQDVYRSAGVLARRDILPGRTDLRAERAGRAGCALADQLFERTARAYLGFARRHTPFFSSQDEQGAMHANNLWLLWRGGEPVGYAIAHQTEPVLRLTNLHLVDRADAVAATAALVRELGTRYVWVRVDQPVHHAQFTCAGFQPAKPDWSVFMVKPLAAGASAGQFRSLYGIDSGRFLVSCLDVTQTGKLDFAR